MRREAECEHSQSQGKAGGQRNKPQRRGNKKNAKKYKRESTRALERPLAGQGWSNRGWVQPGHEETRRLRGRRGRGKKNSSLVGRPFVGFERVQSLAAPCRHLAGFTNRDDGAERGLACLHRGETSVRARSHAHCRPNKLQFLYSICYTVIGTKGGYNILSSSLLKISVSNDNGSQHI